MAVGAKDFLNGGLAPLGEDAWGRISDADGVGFTYLKPTAADNAAAGAADVTSVAKQALLELEATQNKAFWENPPDWMASAIHVVEVQTGRTVAEFKPEDHRRAQHLLLEYVDRASKCGHGIFNPAGPNGLKSEGSDGLNFACSALFEDSNLPKDKPLPLCHFPRAVAPDLIYHKVNQNNAMLSHLTYFNASALRFPGALPLEIALCPNLSSLSCYGIMGSSAMVGGVPLETLCRQFPKLRKIKYTYSQIDPENPRCSPEVDIPVEELQTIANTYNVWIQMTISESYSASGTFRHWSGWIGPGVCKWRDDRSLGLRDSFLNVWDRVSLSIRSLWWRFCQWIQGNSFAPRGN